MAIFDPQSTRSQRPHRAIEAKKDIGLYGVAQDLFDLRSIVICKCSSDVGVPFEENLRPLTRGALAPQRITCAQPIDQFPVIGAFALCVSAPRLQRKRPSMVTVTKGQGFHSAANGFEDSRRVPFQGLANPMLHTLSRQSVSPGTATLNCPVPEENCFHLYRRSRNRYDPPY